MSTVEQARRSAVCAADMGGLCTGQRGEMILSRCRRYCAKEHLRQAAAHQVLLARGTLKRDSGARSSGAAGQACGRTAPSSSAMCSSAE
eukprot:3080956-Prymnesium_polylepis.1